MIYLTLAWAALAMIVTMDGGDGTTYALIAVAFAVLQVAQTIRDKGE